MTDNTSKIIDELLDGCLDNRDLYQRYLSRICWRVEGDFAFLSKKFPEPISILDVGAVPPLLPALFADSGQNNITVLDPKADVFADYFHKKNIAYYQENLLKSELPTFETQFDLVCLCEVIEHLSGDILQSLEAVASWVKPGGYLYVTTPNLRSISGAYALYVQGSGLASKPHETVRKQYERVQGGEGYYGHIREYTGNEIKLLIESFGFKQRAVSYQYHPRTETKTAKVIQLLERYFYTYRLFGKYLFQKKG